MDKILTVIGGFVGGYFIIFILGGVLMGMSPTDAMDHATSGFKEIFQGSPNTAVRARYDAMEAHRIDYEMSLMVVIANTGSPEGLMTLPSDIARAKEKANVLRQDMAAPFPEKSRCTKKAQKMMDSYENAIKTVIDKEDKIMTYYGKFCSFDEMGKHSGQEWIEFYNKTQTNAEQMNKVTEATANVYQNIKGMHAL